MKMNDFEIEAMLSIRLYQQFFIFVISPDHNTVITKSFFVLMLDSEDYIRVDVENDQGLVFSSNTAISDHLYTCQHLEDCFIAVLL